MPAAHGSVLAGLHLVRANRDTRLLDGLLSLRKLVSGALDVLVVLLALESLGTGEFRGPACSGRHWAADARRGNGGSPARGPAATCSGARAIGGAAWPRRDGSGRARPGVKSRPCGARARRVHLEASHHPLSHSHQAGAIAGVCLGRLGRAAWPSVAIHHEMRLLPPGGRYPMSEPQDLRLLPHGGRYRVSDPVRAW